MSIVAHVRVSDLPDVSPLAGASGGHVQARMTWMMLADQGNAFQVQPRTPTTDTDLGVPARQLDQDAQDKIKEEAKDRQLVKDGKFSTTEGRNLIAGVMAVVNGVQTREGRRHWQHTLKTLLTRTRKNLYIPSDDDEQWNDLEIVRQVFALIDNGLLSMEHLGAMTFHDLNAVAMALDHFDSGKDDKGSFI